MSTFREIDGRALFWQDKNKTIHRVEGGYLPDRRTRILWTDCKIDVPANTAFSSTDAKVTCAGCIDAEKAMSESLPKCKLCGSEPEDPDYGNDGKFYTCCSQENDPSCPEWHRSVTVDQWRTLHDQSHCAELEANLNQVIQSKQHIEGMWRNESKISRGLREVIADIEVELSQLKTCEYVPRSMHKKLEAENAALREDRYKQFLKFMESKYCEEGAKLADSRLPPTDLLNKQYFFGQLRDWIRKFEAQQSAPGGEHE